MDRTLTRRHLAEAERTVALGQSHLERQFRIIAELERRGHDATGARDLLVIFLAIQAQHEAHRDQLLEELNLLKELNGLH